jgi:CRISPR-associated protein Cmr2
MGHAIDLVARRAKGDPLENHQRLGRHLDKFALGCRERVEAHGGSLLYAGGDDVMAMLPLHTALPCARALKMEFDAAMASTNLFPIDDGGTPVTPTLSVGLAVAHHLDAMGEVRELAKQAEGIAKNCAGRNALAIVASKRSGGTITAFGKWDVPAGLSVDRRLAEWGRLLASGSLPDGVAWALEETMAPFEAGDDGATPDVVSRLVERVFARRRDAAQQPLGAAVRELLDAAFAAHGATVKGVLRISEEIQLSRVFLSAWDDAWEVCS